MACHATVVDKFGPQLSRVRHELGVASFRVAAVGKISVMQSASKQESLRASWSDVARHLLEALGGLVGVLVWQSAATSGPGTFGQLHRVKTGGIACGLRGRFFLRLGVPGHHALADHIQKRGAVVVRAPVARSEQELADLHFKSIAYPQ